MFAATRTHIPRYWIPALILIPLFFAFLGIYAFPIADDYSYALMFRKTGLIDSFQTMYATWSGRYLSNIVLALLGSLSRNTALYHLYPTFHIICLSWAVLAIVDACHTGNLKSKLFIGLIFIATYLAGMPSPSQGIYWMAGSFTYQLGINGLLGCLAVLVRTAVSHERPGPAGYTVLGLSAIACFGSNELSAATGFTAFTIFAAVAYFSRHPLRSWFVGAACAITPLFLCSFLAPGNFARAATQVHDPSPLHRLWFCFHRSLGGAFEGFKWLGLSAFFPAVLVTLPFFRPAWSGLPISRWSTRKNMLGFLIIGLGIFFCDYFITYWSSHKAPYSRINNAIHADAIIYGCAFFFIFHKQIQTFVNTKIFRKKFISSLTLFCIFFAVLLGQKNISLSAYNMITGKLSTFKNEQELRYVAISSAPEHTILPTLTHKPFPVFFRDIDDKKRGWILNSFQAYWNISSLTFKHSSNE